MSLPYSIADTAREQSCFCRNNPDGDATRCCAPETRFSNSTESLTENDTNNLPCRNKNAAAWLLYPYPQLHASIHSFLQTMKETEQDDMKKPATQITLPSILMQEGPNSQQREDGTPDSENA